MTERFYTLQDVDFLVHLLWVLPLLAGLYFLASARSRSCLQSIADYGKIPLFNDKVNNSYRFWKAVMCIIASAFIIVALSRPSWNPKPVVRMQKGRDVVFVLDISRSMYGRDIKPSRLERAKLSIEDCLGKIRGDRVGLVVFSGSAKVVCPLTLDYGFFKSALDEVNYMAVDRGGTMVGEAIRKAALDLLDDKSHNNKDLIIITDGGDDDDVDRLNSRYALEAAREAAAKNIRIISIGIGDEKKGSRIPLYDNEGNIHFLQDKGKDVWTKLNAKMLREVALATTGGKYVNWGTGDFDLGSLYSAIISSADKNELQEKTVRRYEEKFQIFLAVALAILCLECIVGERRKS